MEAIKYNLFDLFVYVIPGGLTITTLLMCYQLNNFSYASLVKLLEPTNFGTVSMFIILSYILGFIVNIFSQCYLRLYERIIPNAKPIHSNLTNSKKYVLVRELSKENFKHIEHWNVLKNFSTNLATVLLLIIVVLFLETTSFRLLHFIAGLACSILLVKQAAKYNRWCIIDLDNAVHLYKLEDQPDKLLRNTNNDNSQCN